MLKTRTAFAIVVAVALGFLGSQSAEAQLGKRKKTAIKKMGSHKRLSKAAAMKMTAAKQITASDIRKSQAKLRKLASKKEGLIRRGIRLLESTLKLADPDSRKYPDYLFRVAEHYNAMRMNQWKSGMSMHDKIFTAEEAGNNALARQLKKRQKLYFDRANYWLRKSLTKYVRITTNKKYNSYSRMDEVIFTVGDIAKSLAEQEKKRGKTAKARQYSQIMMAMFSRLVKEHPRSRFIPDALLAKGEFFFNNRRIVEAIAVFQKVARYKNSPLAPYANYKIGWCYLNLKRYRMALSKFVEVSRGKRGGKNLIQAARKDVVRAYTHIGRPDKAYNFFHNVAKGRPRISKMMFVLLGTMYYAQGKNVDCIKVFQMARKRWPRDKNRCQWATTIVDATINIGNKGAQVMAVKLLGQVTLSLSKQFGLKSPAVVQCRSSTENTMKMLATQWHAEGLKTKNMDTLAKTQALYEAYIKTYPKSKVIFLMRYQYADLLWFFNQKNPNVPLHEWVKLAHVFTALVKTPKPSTMTQKIYVGKRNEAALAAVRCWMKANKITNKEISSMGSKSKSKKVCIKKKRRRCIEYSYTYPKQEIAPAQLAMLEAFKTYIKYVPKSKYLPAIIFNTGHMYWKHNHFDKAIPLFLKVSLNHVTDMPGAARTAAFRIIGMLTVKRRYRDVRKYVNKFIASKKLMEDEEFAAKMHDFKLKAMWADADLLRKSKKFADCGAAFEEMATRYTSASNLDTFFWNAGACYEAAGMLGPAVKMRRTIVQRFKRSKHRALSMYYLAGNFHNLAFFKQAAKWYELFFDKYSKRKEAPESLMWGIVLRGGLGEERKMMKNAAAFIKRYKRRGGKYKKLSAKSFWLVVKMYENQGDEDKVLINLSRYARGYGPAGEVDKYIESLAKLGDIWWRRSCKVTAIHGQCIRIRFYRRKGKKKKQKKIIYVQRDGRSVRTAKRYFARALRVWANGRGLLKIKKNDGDRLSKINNARHYAAQAKFMAAEVLFEDYLRLSLPRKLDFNPRNPSKAKRSIKRFTKWLTAKMKKGGLMVKKFMSVITSIRVKIGGKKRGDAHWSIAAVARAGMIFHNFAELMLSAPVPKFLKGFAARDAYKAQMERVANPLLAKAQGGYKICLALSKKLRWFNEWSRLCEREINRLEPDRYPLASERRAKPGYLSTTIDKADFKFGAR